MCAMHTTERPTMESYRVTGWVDLCLGGCRLSGEVDLKVRRRRRKRRFRVLTREELLRRALRKREGGA
jgi:hypothetical protein